MPSRCSLQLHGDSFDSSAVKGHFYTFLTSRDSCHNCRKCPETIKLEIVANLKNYTGNCV